MMSAKEPRSIVRHQHVTGVKKCLSRKYRKKMTDAEARLWELIRNKKLDGLKFRRQQVVAGYIVDFYCDEEGLVLEADGSVHDEPEQQASDAGRDEVLREKGLHIFRIQNKEILMDASTVIEKIREQVRVVAGHKEPHPLSPSPQGEGAVFPRIELGVR